MADDLDAMKKVDLNVRPIRHILRSFEEEYGKRELKELVRSTGMELEYLEDENHWVSYEYWCELLRALVARTGDTRIALKYGRNSAKYVAAWGVMKPLFATVTSIASAQYLYKAVIRQAARWSKIGTMRFIVLESTRALLEVRMRPGVAQDINNCLNIRGQFSSVPTFLGLPHAAVTELRCAAKGDAACLYEFTWERKRRFDLWFLLLAAGMGLGLLGMILAGWNVWATVVFTDLILLMVLVWREWNYFRQVGSLQQSNDEQAEALMAQLDATEKMNISLIQQVDARTASLKAKADSLEKQTRELLKAKDDMDVTNEKNAISIRQTVIRAFASGMAHEINNPLNAIRLSVGVVRNTLGKGGERARVMCDNADRAVSRCAKVIQDLLQNARAPHRETAIEVGPVVEKAVEAFMSERGGVGGERVSFLCTVEPALPRVKIDPIHLEQIVCNLLKNAVDASLNQGVIEVALENRGDYVLLAVNDRGRGVDEGILDKLYHPALPKSDANLGMGLIMTYQLVRRNDCHISVVSNKDSGTVFYVRMPAVRDVAVAGKRRLELAAEVVG